MPCRHVLAMPAARRLFKNHSIKRLRLLRKHLFWSNFDVKKPVIDRLFCDGWFAPYLAAFTI